MHTGYLFVAVALGWLIHLAGDLAEASVKDGRATGFIDYIRAHPWQLLFSTLGTAAGFLILYPGLVKQFEVGLYEMALATAAGIGYAGDSVVGKLGTFAN